MVVDDEHADGRLTGDVAVHTPILARHRPPRQ
jgi:hypothetical protein